MFKYFLRESSINFIKNNQNIISGYSVQLIIINPENTTGEELSIGEDKLIEVKIDVLEKEKRNQGNKKTKYEMITNSVSDKSCPLCGGELVSIHNLDTKKPNGDFICFTNGCNYKSGGEK